eukprot:8527146-Karenia_brevis.AAC.1
MKGGPGMDGWRVQELQCLHSSLLHTLAEIFNVVEATGRWPKAFLAAPVTLIDKGSGARPVDLRPITVMSAVYRLWASRRLQDLRAWQENWVDEGMHGFRSGHSVRDIFWKVALEVEAAVLHGKP